MYPLIDRAGWLLTFLQRLWIGRFRRSVTTCMVVFVLAANIVNGWAKLPPTLKNKANMPAPEHHHPVSSQLLPSEPVNVVSHGQWMTEAAMTSHNLTAAHFLGHQAGKKLPVRTQKVAKQG